MWEFELGQPVEIANSGERGVVIGRSEYVSSENLYSIRYLAADGRAVEAWWGESALVQFRGAA